MALPVTFWNPQTLYLLPSDMCFLGLLFMGEDHCHMLAGVTRG